MTESMPLLRRGLGGNRTKVLMCLDNAGEVEDVSVRRTEPGRRANVQPTSFLHCGLGEARLSSLPLL